MEEKQGKSAVKHILIPIPMQVSTQTHPWSHRLKLSLTFEAPHSDSTFSYRV